MKQKKYYFEKTNNNNTYDHRKCLIMQYLHIVKYTLEYYHNTGSANVGGSHWICNASIW